MTHVNTANLALELAREYLAEPDNRIAEALGRRLSRLARGRAVLVDGQVVIPHPSGHLAVHPAWDVEAGPTRPVVVPWPGEADPADVIDPRD